MGELQADVSGPDPFGAVPLPGTAAPSSDFPRPPDFPAPPSNQQAASAELDFNSAGFWEDTATGAESAKPGGAPAPSDAGLSFDFELPKGDAADDGPAWAKTELPDLSQAQPLNGGPELDLQNVPPPGSDQGGLDSLDLSDLPAPAEEPLPPMDLSNLPSPADEMGAGPEEVSLDLSGLPPPPSEQGKGDAAPVPSHPVQGLETLSFDDDDLGAEKKPKAKAVHPESTAAPAGSSSEMDRLRKLYDGRMAVVSVVHTESASSKLRKWLPLLAAAGGALLIAGAGLSLGFTPYGFFGLKKLLLPQISSGSPQFSKLQEAKRALLVDTLQSYREARDRCAEVLKIKEYPEARAVWIQAIFYLQRRYAATNTQEVSRATSELESIRLLGAKHPEVIKAKAGGLFAVLRADPILPILQEAVARPQNANDLEMQLLLAESFALKNQTRQAIEVLNRVVAKDKQCAKAFHALGNLYQSLKQPDKAVTAYGKALEADPKHLSSAVELGAVHLLVLKDATAGAEAIERALVEGSERLLGPMELAKARALNGVALAAQNKRKEAIAQFELALKADPASLFAKAGLAEALLSEREYAKSAALYKEVVAQDAVNQDNWDSYLSALFGARKLEEALAAVTQANTHFSGSARIAYQFGRIQDVLGDRPEAERHYKHAINADPKLVAPQVALARFYLRTQRLPEAKAQLEQALTVAPEAPSVHAAIGEVALAEDDAAKAKAELEKAVSEDARLPEAYLGLAELAYSEGALETALKQVDRALALEPYLRDARMQRGLILWKLRKLDLALEDLKEARAQEPRSSKIARANGAVLLDKGDVPAAEAVLLEAVALEPYNAESHFYLARARSRRGDHNLAIESMRNALERAPKNPAYHYEMGLIQKEAKNIQAAVDEWKRALELDPEYADALEALGHSYLDRGDYDSAVASFEKALKADPKRSRMQAQIGDCYFQTSKWDQALSHYLAGLKADPNLTSVYYKIGRTYTEKGKHGTAIDWYRKATDADKKDAMAYYYLGYAYKERRRSKDAIGAFKEYLTLKPEADDKKEIEDEIYDLGHEK